MNYMAKGTKGISKNYSILGDIGFTVNFASIK